jgi:Domain of unknown function (DUF6458)
MAIGTSLFLIAVGAILRYAITAHVDVIDLRVTGLILMIVGVIGLLITIAMLLRDRSGPPPRGPL